MAEIKKNTTTHASVAVSSTFIVLSLSAVFLPSTSWFVGHV